MRTACTLLLAGAVILGSLSGAACTNMSKTQQGTLSGAAIGAGVGAGISAIAGGSGSVGALVGGGLGALAGGLYGHNKDK